MGRKMTPLEALKRVKQARYFIDFELDAKVGEDYKEELKIIETELKEKEQQDNVLKVLKEVIEFAVVLPEVKPTKDDVFSVISAVSINAQRAIENKKRELFRQWVLDTCFPKELKALEIIKEKRTDVGYLMSCDFLCDYNDCDETPYDKPLTQEEYDLLVEVLLGEKQ